MIDIESLRKYKSIKIIGHKHADFDSMASGYLLEHIFVNLGINAEFVLQDGEVDNFFKEKWIGRHKTWKSRENDVLFLVDHTASYDFPVVGCFDHHPELVHIEQNYVNEPKTSCAKVIYDWTESIGFEIEEFGSSSFKISEVPLMFANINFEKFINSFLHNLDATEVDISYISEKLARAACRAAIKAGDKMSDDDISYLKKLLDNADVLRCPHGRPVVIKISKYEIEKWFKRVI